MNSLTPELIQQITQTVLQTIQTSPYFLPKKNNSILLWKHKHLPNTFTLKFNGQRLVGSLLTDCQGQSYWKFSTRENEEKPANQAALLKEPKPAQFPASQAKTALNNEPTNPSENAPNSQAN